MTRRECLQTAAAAGAAVLAPTIVPASALGRGGAVAPSERIVLGAIGIGSRGEFDLKWMLRETDVQFVAICDAHRTTFGGANHPTGTMVYVPKLPVSGAMVSITGTAVLD